jgi:hypothetical protein
MRILKIRLFFLLVLLMTIKPVSAQSILEYDYLSFLSFKKEVTDTVVYENQQQFNRQYFFKIVQYSEVYIRTSILCIHDRDTIFQLDEPGYVVSTIRNEETIETVVVDKACCCNYLTSISIITFNCLSLTYKIQRLFIHENLIIPQSQPNESIRRINLQEVIYLRTGPIDRNEVIQDHCTGEYIDYFLIAELKPLECHTLSQFANWDYVIAKSEETQLANGMIEFWYFGWVLPKL